MCVCVKHLISWVPVSPVMCFLRNITIGFRVQIPLHPFDVYFRGYFRGFRILQPTYSKKMATNQNDLTV